MLTHWAPLPTLHIGDRVNPPMYIRQANPIYFWALWSLCYQNKSKKTVQKPKNSVPGPNILPQKVKVLIFPPSLLAETCLLYMGGLTLFLASLTYFLVGEAEKMKMKLPSSVCPWRATVQFMSSDSFFSPALVCVGYNICLLTSSTINVHFLSWKILL